MIKCTKCFLHKKAKNQPFPKLKIGEKVDVILIVGYLDETCDDLNLVTYGVQKRILDYLLEESGMSEYSYKIIPSLFCRSFLPNGKTCEPTPPELLMCEPNYLKLFEILSPKLCILLGEGATSYYDKLTKGVIFKSITGLLALELSGGLKSPHIDHCLSVLKKSIKHIEREE